MKQTHIPYAVITAIVMVIIDVALYMGGLSFASWAQYVSLIPFLIGILLNAVAFSKANDQFVTFGNVFGSGFRVTAIIILISIVWGFISLMIFPEIVDKAIAMASEKMTKDGKLSDDQIEKAIEMTRKSFKLFMVAGILFGDLFMGQPLDTAQYKNIFYFSG